MMYWPTRLDYRDPSPVHWQNSCWFDCATLERWAELQWPRPLLSSWHRSERVHSYWWSLAMSRSYWMLSPELVPLWNSHAKHQRQLHRRSGERFLPHGSSRVRRALWWYYSLSHPILSLQSYHVAIDLEISYWWTTTIEKNTQGVHHGWNKICHASTLPCVSPFLSFWFYTEYRWCIDTLSRRLQAPMTEVSDFPSLVIASHVDSFRHHWAMMLFVHDEASRRLFPFVISFHYCWWWTHWHYCRGRTMDRSSIE